MIIQFGGVNNLTTFASGALHQVFPQGVSGGATDYALVEVRNISGVTLSGVTAWLTLDPTGAAVALAVADGTARAIGHNSYSVNAAALTYSTPTTQSGGLALPNLAANEKCLLALRRVLSGAGQAWPENNVLNIGGTRPL